MYSDVTEINGNKVKTLSIEGFRKEDIFYKRRYIDAAFHDQIEFIEEYFDELKESDKPKEDKRKDILQKFFILEMVALTDFLNHYPLTAKIAYNLFLYNIFIDNISYSKEKEDDSFSKYRRLYKDINGFDWKEAVNNNYKFILVL